MELIKIIFYIIGTFFGIENSGIASEIVTVTVYPERNAIEIAQNNLVTFYETETDSITSYNELKKIMDIDVNLAEPLQNKDFPIINYPLTANKVDQTLSYHWSIFYTKPENLKAFALDYNKEKKHYSLINIPRWKIESEDGKIEGNYWIFDAEKPFSFTMSPLSEIPEQHKDKVKSLFPIWQAISKEKKN